MLAKIRHWLEKHMDVLLIALGTAGLAGVYGFVTAYLTSTPRNHAFVWWTIVFFLLALVGYIAAYIKIAARERREADEAKARELREIDRDKLLKESNDTAKEAHKLAKLNSHGPN